MAVIIAMAWGAMTVQAVDRFVSLEGGHVAPFTSWSDAATNIQDAIDASVAGDTVWVTNGLYNTGGKVMEADLTNRVALDKAVTLQSVNGPQFTIIEGLGFGGTNAVRSAWLTNGAVLSGFTVQRGGTRTSGDKVTLRNGGGVWCNSTTAIVTNCLIRWNTANGSGGGVFRGTILKSTLWANTSVSSLDAGGGAAEAILEHCVLTGNVCYGGNGGGAVSSSLKNCAVLGNYASSGGGASDCFLYNCTVTRNEANWSAGGCYFRLASPGSGGRIWNSIVYGNLAYTITGSDNFERAAFTGLIQYSCTTPLPNGYGNIAIDPQLLSDGIHLSETSPCRGAGNTNYSSGLDYDGQTWLNPPSMGCDEWQPEPLAVGLPQLSHEGGIGEVSFNSFAIGAEPLGYGWVKDGSLLFDGDDYLGTKSLALRVRVGDPTVAGQYALVVSNTFGMVTGQVARLTLHYVDVASSNPSSPYSDWGSAAVTIQDAVDDAFDGEVVVVTNGLYSTGGRPHNTSELTNRVVVDKPLKVVSVGGAALTVIQGACDPDTTNGPLAVRCAWLDPSAVVKGFTIKGGATLLSGSTDDLNGGGVLSGFVDNCVIEDCRASEQGGGASRSQCSNSEITRNIARQGGGTARSWVSNCTITANSAIESGGGMVGWQSRNSIIYLNSAPQNENYISGGFMNCCSLPLPSGSGNIDEDPQLMGGACISPTSPCRGAGNSLYSMGVDLDGQAWLNPPSMGCDEVYEPDLVGPLSVALTASDTNVVQGVPSTLTGLIEGFASSLAWGFGDGGVATNVSYITAHSWTNAGDYTVTFTAYNVNNPAGVSTNVIVHVLPIELPELTGGILTNSTFNLEFASQSGVTYVVEQATNLVPPVVWSAVTSRTGNGELVQVSEPAATNDMRFYRVRVP